MLTQTPDDHEWHEVLELTLEAFGWYECATAKSDVC
jgi:hypothetical protein